LRDDGLKSAALGALQSYGDPAIGSTVIDLYSNLPDQVRAAISDQISRLAARSTGTLSVEVALTTKASTLIRFSISSSSKDCSRVYLKRSLRGVGAGSRLRKR